MRTILLCCLLLVCLASNVFSQSPYIHVNQFGYWPNAVKVAVLSDPQAGYNSTDSYTPSAQLQVRDAVTDAVVYSTAPTVWNGGNTHAQSGDVGFWLDFSPLTTPGEYYLLDPGNNERSAVFRIQNGIYDDILKAAGRMFYYNRCGIAKAAPYAEVNWRDASSFAQDANTRYIYDPTNVALEKDMSGGWFDAGDYNKYVTFTVSVIHDLLWAYRENPTAFGDNWNIPESGNGIPDLLDEIKWELDWLLKMNNVDGSTHIKMGSRNYAENTSSPPSLNTDTRYYGPTCSAASIAVAGIFAHAATVFDAFPGLNSYRNLLENRAISSWAYVLPLLGSGNLDEACDDGSIVSGDADWTASVQRDQAVTSAVHLWELTGNSLYNTYITANAPNTEPLSTNFWGIANMALTDALLLYTILPGGSSSLKSNITSSFTTAVGNNWNDFFGFSNSDLYRSQMPDWSYHWGSNKSKAEYGVLNRLIVNYGIAPANNDSYTQKALEHIHYFCGVNPQGLVYLSNMYSLGGDRCVNEIYHGWFADGTDWDHALNSLYGPAPGYVSGGANKDFTQNFSPPANQPIQKSYLDFNDDWPRNS
ncbi:MAG: glycoside hydrolase family 9 protein, partial [Bacteroidota bacterium]